MWRTRKGEEIEEEALISLIVIIHVSIIVFVLFWRAQFLSTAVDSFLKGVMWNKILRPLATNKTNASFYYLHALLVVSQFLPARPFICAAIVRFHDLDRLLGWTRDILGGIELADGFLYQFCETS